MAEPFIFRSDFHLVRLLGLKAQNPAELLEHIRQVPLSSIYYHTHRFLQQHHYLSPEPPNDFAYWTTNILGLETLGEHLASVDIVRFAELEALRNVFISILSDYITKGKYCLSCEPGEEFHFVSCVTLVVPTPYVAHTVQEFLEIIPKLSVHSLYFHVFEARLRLKRADNDFSRWLKDIGLEQIARDLSRLDPYTITLEGLREKIIRTVRKYV